MSEQLRAAYNACLPLLSEYHTDLAQSERLYRAYAQISQREGPTLDAVQREVIEHALREFRLAGVGLPAERKDRFKAVMLELTQLQAKFEENVLDATNGWTYHVTDANELLGLSVNGLTLRTAERRNRDRREDADDQADDQQLDQREAALLRRALAQPALCAGDAVSETPTAVRQ